MIRILQVLGTLERGGAETMVMNIYRNIDRSNIQFDFIIHTEEHQAYHDEILELGGKIYSFPRFNGKTIFSLRKKWNQFFAIHPEYKILHSHVRSYASLYIAIAKKHGLKTIVHSHSTSNGSGISSVVKKVMQYPLRFQADYLFSCSKEAGEWLFGHKVVDRKNYYMLQNAVDTEKYSYNSGTRREYREQLELNDAITYVHVGRLHPSKNHMFLLDVFKKINDENSNTALLLVGDGSLKNVIEEKIQKLSLSDSIKMLGSREDVPELLQASDVFLFPSKWEGLPVTVVEAQAASLPCIISDRITTDVDVSELVYRLPIDSAEDWAKLALSNIDKKCVADKVRKAGFDVKESAKRITDMYLNMIGDGQCE